MQLRHRDLSLKKLEGLETWMFFLVGDTLFSPELANSSCGLRRYHKLMALIQKRSTICSVSVFYFGSPVDHHTTRQLRLLELAGSCCVMDGIRDMVRPL